MSSPDGTNVGNIFVYVGDYPNYTNCPTGSWENSGDLLEAGKYVDASQIQAGAQYKPYADAVTDFGAYEVLSIVLVIDSGWAFPTTGQIVEVDNVRINAGRYSFETANSCKNGGWENFTSAPGPFTNQGQCVSYFAKGGQ